jgi:hypothetical protein
MKTPDPHVLGATVDQLQMEVDRLARELLIGMGCVLALSLLLIVTTFKMRGGE